jgi:hypothetical protein
MCFVYEYDGPFEGFQFAYAIPCGFNSNQDFTARCKLVSTVAHHEYLPTSSRPYLKSVSIASLVSIFEPLYFPTSKLPH